MAIFFYKGTYTDEAWTALTAKPVDISEAMRPSIEAFGGKPISCFIFMAGAEPGGFIEFPNNVAATAWALSLQKKGTLSRFEITHVLTPQEGIEMLKRLGGGQSSPGTSTW